MIDLETWRRMEAQCTEGEWSFDGFETISDNQSRTLSFGESGYDDIGLTGGDAEAVTHFRNHAKAAAEEIEELRKRVAELEYKQNTQRTMYCCQCGGVRNDVDVSGPPVGAQNVEVKNDHR